MILKDYLTNLRRPIKKTFVRLVDMLLCLLSLWLAYYLRLDSWFAPTVVQKYHFILSPIFVIIIFTFIGLYNAIFRYAGQYTILNVLNACFIYMVSYSIFSVFIFEPGDVPRSVVVIQALILFFLVSLSRIAARKILGDIYREIFREQESKSVLVWGTTDYSRQIAYSLSKFGIATVYGFLDDGHSMVGGKIDNFKVFHIAQLESLKDLGVRELVIGEDVVPSKKTRILNEALKLHIHVRVVPHISELMQANANQNSINLRELNVDELLNRSVNLEEKNQDELHQGKTILVTGGGGSIGGELVRQLMRLEPARLIILDHSEYNLYSIQNEIELVKESTTHTIFKLGTVLDEAELEKVFLEFQPDIVYHAAAYKHVPIVEANYASAIRNNIFGTWQLVNLSKKYHVSKFVLISTDKAVRPTNIMGATKRLAELILQAESRETNSKTCFTMVRFGNVLGSSGSVIPLFREQIKSGGPITVTHPEVTRYFMTIPEAAQLVLEAARMSVGGEVFLLDMGEPVKIIDLAKNIISLSGMSEKTIDDPDGDIEIIFTGLRPGEKMYEELLVDDNARVTSNPRIKMANEPSFDKEFLYQKLNQLQAVAVSGKLDSVKSILTELVVGYVAADHEELA